MDIIIAKREAYHSVARIPSRGSVKFNFPSQVQVIGTLKDKNEDTEFKMLIR